MTPAIQDLRGRIAAYDAAIAQLRADELVLGSAGRPAPDRRQQRWQLELLRAGAAWELQQLEDPLARAP